VLDGFAYCQSNRELFTFVGNQFSLMKLFQLLSDFAWSFPRYRRALTVTNYNQDRYPISLRKAIECIKQGLGRGLRNRSSHIFTLKLDLRFTFPTYRPFRGK